MRCPYEGLWWTYRPRRLAPNGGGRGKRAASRFHAYLVRAARREPAGDSADEWRYGQSVEVRERTAIQLPRSEHGAFLVGVLYYDVPAMLSAAGNDRPRRKTVL